MLMPCSLANALLYKENLPTHNVVYCIYLVEAVEQMSKILIMYSKISTRTYRDAPCQDSQFHCCPNYVYRSVETLSKLEMPKSLEITWCRTVGILQSFNGQVYVCGMNSTGGVASELRIRVSMQYLESSKHIATLQSIVMPCPIQIFGSIQWLSENPVVYVKLIQVLTATKALQMKDTMDHLIDFICHGNTTINT